MASWLVSACALVFSETSLGGRAGTLTRLGQIGGSSIDNDTSTGWMGTLVIDSYNTKSAPTVP